MEGLIKDEGTPGSACLTEMVVMLRHTIPAMGKALVHCILELENQETHTDLSDVNIGWGQGKLRFLVKGTSV